MPREETSRARAPGNLRGDHRSDGVSPGGGLRTDYERDPIVTAGFVWAAHARLLLRRLTTP